MTTEELCERVAKIEGWEYWEKGHNGVPTDRFVNEYGFYEMPREFAFQLIEKYRLTIEEDGQDWCVFKHKKNCAPVTIRDKDLLTAVFKMVREVY